MSRVPLSLILSVSLALSACSTFEGYPDKAPLVSSKTLDDWVSQYENTSMEQRGLVRNDLLRRYMITVDSAYEQFEQDIYVQNLRGTVYTDWSSNLLTSASPVTDHIPTRNALAGLSTILSGGKAIYESNVLAKGIMPALITEMRTSREEVRNTIRARSALPASQYDLYDALVDVNEYKVAGSIPHALASLNARASEDKKSVEKETDTSFRPLGFGGEYTPIDTGSASTAPVSAPIPYSVETPPPPDTQPSPPDTRVPSETARTSPTIQPPGSEPQSNVFPNNVSNDFISNYIKEWAKENGNKEKLQAWLKKDRSRPQDIHQFLTESRYMRLRFKAYDEVVKR